MTGGLWWPQYRLLQKTWNHSTQSKAGNWLSLETRKRQKTGSQYLVFCSKLDLGAVFKTRMDPVIKVGILGRNVTPGQQPSTQNPTSTYKPLLTPTNTMNYINYVNITLVSKACHYTPHTQLVTLISYRVVGRL